MDQLDKGLSGFVCQVTTEDPSVCRIDNVTFPAWAYLSSADQIGSNRFSLRAIDMNSTIKPGEQDVLIASIGITGIAAGNSTVTLEPAKFDDLNGNPITVETGIGHITVKGADIQSHIIDLKTGWNLIGIPADLKPGSDTALIFKDVPSNGHSILSYTAQSGWITIGKDEVLSPMNAYWIYTSRNLTVPLDVQGPATENKKLSSGWNIAGIAGVSPRSSEEALHSLQDWTYVIGYDPSLQRYQPAIIRTGNRTADKSLLYPCQGYWIYLSSPEILQP